MAADPLAKACELAFEVARQGVETDPPVDPPASMRSFLYVAQLPPRAVSVAQRVLDSDTEFRTRVAAEATEASVGQAGYLWLTRPDGWQASYSALTGSMAPTGGVPSTASPAVPPPPPAPPATQGERPAPLPASERPAPPAVPAATAVDVGVADAGAGSDDLETELSSLRNLVDQLAEERESVVAPLAAAAAPAAPAPTAPTPSSSTPAAPAPAPSAPVARPDSSSLTRQLDALTADLRTARTERNDALSDKETSIARQLILEEELNGLRADAAQHADRLTELEADRSSLELSLSESQTTVSELEAKLTTVETVGAEVNSRIENLTAERDNALQVNATVTGERDELVAQARVAEQARVDLETELAEVSSKWQDAQVQLTNVDEQRTALESEVAELRQSRALANQEHGLVMSSMTANLRQIEAERDELASKLDVAQRQLAATRSAIDEASTAIGNELGLTEAAMAEVGQRVDALNEALTTTNQTLIEAPDSSAVDPIVDEAPTLVDAPSPAPEVTPAAPEMPPVLEESADPAPEREEDVSVFGATPAAPVAPAAPSIPAAPSAPAIEELVSEDAGLDDDVFSDEPQTIPVPHQGGFVADVSTTETTDHQEDTSSEEAGQEDASLEDSSQDDSSQDDSSQDDANPEDVTTEEGTEPVGVTRQQVSPIAGDPEAVARHTVSTPDVVLLVHGDPVALLGWPDVDVATRRAHLVSFLGELASETGAAPDVVFDGKVGDESALPTSRVVRVRLTNADVDAEEALSPLVDSYPKQWPVAVVTDSPSLVEKVRGLGASVIENGHMLDLFLAP